MMTRAVRRSWAAVLYVGLMAAPAVLIGQHAGDPAVLRSFHSSVNQYAALHRRLEGPLPPRVPARETFSALVARRYLASAIRGARPSARAGDIFDAAAAAVFRELIAEAYREPGGGTLAQEFRRRAAHPVPDPIVNEPYAMNGASLVPGPILAKLPALAEDVEYRAVNADLILWDIHAEIVIDVLPRAFLPAAT